MGVVRDLPEAVEASFEAWRSPLRFEVIHLDQEHPVGE
jgi:hypothetical protein